LAEKPAFTEKGDAVPVLPGKAAVSINDSWVNGVANRLWRASGYSGKGVYSSYTQLMIPGCREGSTGLRDSAWLRRRRQRIYGTRSVVSRQYFPGSCNNLKVQDTK